ncbi:hypothetical protein CTZ27_06975 [Streptomyces griseocarneus]|nr:hypothetical protein CTZ27_06975 [Streptomyces griseocarneus]
MFLERHQYLERREAEGPRVGWAPSAPRYDCGDVAWGPRADASVEGIDTPLAELADSVCGAVAPDNLTPIALLLTQRWHSAEIYADPTPHAILVREPEGDLGLTSPCRDGGTSPKRGDRAVPQPINGLVTDRRSQRPRP